MEARTARLLARVCLVRSVHVCEVVFCKRSFCMLAGAGLLPLCFYFRAQELELSAAAGIQCHRFLLPVGLRARADAVVDLVEVESSKSSEYTVDPPVALEGRPDVRYCPKCKTVSFLRKGQQDLRLPEFLFQFEKANYTSTDPKQYGQKYMGE